MPLTVKQAAEATGKSKPTILRAIQSHKISAARDDATGAWLIEAAELHRIYPPASSTDTHQSKIDAMTRDASHDEAVVVRLELLLQQLETEREDRRRERRDAEATIDDLRRRLDREGEERRRLTAILTDQRAQQPVVPPVEASPSASPEPRRSWWRFGKR